MVKIVKVDVHVLQAPCEKFAFSQRWVDTRVGLVVEITTDTGITGWGDGYGPPWIHETIIKRHFESILIGANPLEGDKLWEIMYNELRDHGQKGVVIQAISSVDCALWDIRGKHFGVPVHVLMGGPIRKEIKAYATGFYRKSDDREENHRLMKEEAELYLSQGFKAMKIKLYIDANHGCDTISAIKLSKAVEQYDIGWFEEPCEPEDLKAYKEIKAKTNIPMAGGECDFTRYGFRDILLSEAIDIIQPDTAAAGGLTECKKIADMAAVFGVRYLPTGPGLGVEINREVLMQYKIN
eukprot:gene8516-27834_t